MKVINGEFGSKKTIEETPLLDKLAVASAQMVNSETELGNFILIVESTEGLAQVATDMSAAEINLLLDIIKQQLLTGTFDKGAIH